MTEAEWLACTDSIPMLEFMRRKGSGRKLRLFACACCRRIWPLFKDETINRDAVFVSERYADGLATLAQLRFARRLRNGHLTCEYWAAHAEAFNAAAKAAHYAANKLRYLTYAPGEGFDILIMENGATTTAGDTTTANRLVAEQKLDQAKLLIDIFFNPFRRLPSLDSAVLAWNDCTVRRIAQAIYDDRAFDHMPILADALEDAGCDNADLLNHCRQPGEHVRGCWVVDLLLGKA